MDLTVITLTELRYVAVADTGTSTRRDRRHVTQPTLTQVKKLRRRSARLERTARACG
jgi:hypothetical protein